MDSLNEGLNLDREIDGIFGGDDTDINIDDANIVVFVFFFLIFDFKSIFIGITFRFLLTFFFSVNVIR